MKSDTLYMGLPVPWDTDTDFTRHARLPIALVREVMPWGFAL